jgi:hypothetical protein
MQTMRTVLPAALLGTLMTSAVCVAADRELATLNFDANGVTLTAKGPRPIKEAVKRLAFQYEQMITYEDPRYAFDADLADVTASVRRGLTAAELQKSPRIIVPRGGTLIVRSSSGDTESVLAALVSAQTAGGTGGRFRLERSDNAFHVVPTEIRDRDGNWTVQTSVLDSRISFPVESRAAYQTIQAICLALTESAGFRVQMGTGLSGGGLESGAGGPAQYKIGADNEPARAVLLRALDAIATEPGAITWLLLYDAGDHFYALNLFPVIRRPPFPPAQPKPPSSSGTHKLGN